MGELTTRGYRPADAADLSDFFNLLESAAGGHPGNTAERIGAMLAATLRDPAADSRLLFAPDGALVAVGLVPAPPDGGNLVDLYGGVHPGWRGRGIGCDLLGWQLARSADLRRLLAPDAEWEAETAAIVGDEATDRLMARLGLPPVRYFSDMVAPTAGAPSAPLPAGLRSEPFREELSRALHAAHMETFADHWGFQRRGFEEWLPFTLASGQFRPDLSRIAFDGADIAGYLLSYDHISPDRLYIGQVGTRRPWRRRGLAGALLAEVLAAAAGAGKDLAGLVVDADSPTGAVGVYERVGFAVEYRALAYRRTVD
jgi:ribosomal protein S18 acetylase RimI-like enzyme